ncbi:hypothetical protein M569_09001, partial [Genlisea aurea]
DVGERWKEFQGIRNWEGMLDPLDDGLRDEILRYGEFVEAAYRCFESDAAPPCGDGGLRMNGYKLTRSVHATCGIQLPNLTDRIPQWMSSWIGYVAVCDDADEIARLGRRDVVVAYRGTSTCMEWLENLRATLTCLPSEMSSVSGSKVQSGFLSLYTSSTPEKPSLQTSVKEEINRILRKYAGEPLSITITGHSLGAALATLTAYDIATTVENPPLVTVVSFGGPRVGNKTFRRQLEKTAVKVLRIVNSDDPITKVPGFVLEDGGAAAEKTRTPRSQSTAMLKWLHRRAEEAQLVYAEIGEELRLSSNDSPYLNNPSVATCHDLKTYLHLVDNFVSSNCPIRATAKMVLEK